jgi:hypothetical protein
MSSQYPRGGLEGYSIRTREHRYVQWRKGETVQAEEVYHYADSLNEKRNIATSDKALTQRMSDALAKGWRGHLPAA